MNDIPAQTAQMVQEYVVNESKQLQVSNEAFYHISEQDLSFSDDLSGSCSSETSSGPATRHVRFHSNRG